MDYICRAASETYTDPSPPCLTSGLGLPAGCFGLVFHFKVFLALEDKVNLTFVAEEDIAGLGTTSFPRLGLFMILVLVVIVVVIVIVVIVIVIVDFFVLDRISEKVALVDIRCIYFPFVLDVPTPPVVVIVEPVLALPLRGCPFLLRIFF